MSAGFVAAAAVLCAAMSAGPAEPADAGAPAADAGRGIAAATPSGAGPSADAGSSEAPDAAAEAPAKPAARARRAIPGEKRAPVALLTYLRKKTLGDWCARANWSAPAPLQATRFLELRGDALLLFVQVPSYLCSSSNTAVPVVFTATGEWRWGLPVDGLVTHLARAEDGTLWASTQWQIEGTYPALFSSKDGIAWKEVELPRERATAGPMEELTTLCFGYRTVVVKIDRADDTAPPAAEVCSRERKGDGGWSKDPGGIDSGCLPPLPASERWTRDGSEEDRTLFLRGGGEQVFSLPKLLRPR